MHPLQSTFRGFCQRWRSSSFRSPGSLVTTVPCCFCFLRLAEPHIRAVPQSLTTYKLAFARSAFPRSLTATSLGSSLYQSARPTAVQLSLCSATLPARSYSRLSISAAPPPRVTQLSRRTPYASLQTLTNFRPFSLSSRKMAPVPFQSKANDKGENHYDLIVIGGGSGGLGSARRAAQYGAKVSCCPFLQHP